MLWVDERDLRRSREIEPWFPKNPAKVRAARFERGTEKSRMTADEALAFARKHVETWNTHDLDAIMALYSQSVELVSPLAGAITGSSAVRGQENVRAYFERGLQKYPELKFELVDTFLCDSSITLLFYGAGRRLVAEVLFIDAESTIERVFAHYRVGAS